MTSHLKDILNALADPTRRELFERLISGSATVNELAEPFEMTSVAISKHLRVLERARIVKRTKVGRSIYCTANVENAKPAIEFFEKLKKIVDKKSELHSKYWRAKKEGKCWSVRRKFFGQKLSKNTH